jgi:hypothetical protein
VGVSALVCFGASVFTELGAVVEGRYVAVKSDSSQLNIVMSLESAEELAADLNQCIADLRGNRLAARL